MESHRMGSNFADDLCEMVRVKRKLSWRWKREERHKVGLVREKDKPQRKTSANDTVTITKSELQHLQETGETLVVVQASVRVSATTTGTVFWKEGILCKQWT